MIDFGNMMIGLTTDRLIPKTRGFGRWWNSRPGKLLETVICVGYWWLSILTAEFAWFQTSNQYDDSDDHNRWSLIWYDC